MMEIIGMDYFILEKIRNKMLVINEGRKNGVISFGNNTSI